MAEGYERKEGAMCNIPQDFADKKIGKCPFCGTQEPKWLVKEEWKFFYSNNYYFKCPACETELMVSKDDVTGLGYTTASPAGKRKKKDGKIMNQPYVTVVKIGLSAKTHENMILQGEELPLVQLKNVCGEMKKQK